MTTVIKCSPTPVASIACWDCTDRDVVQGLYKRLGRAVIYRVARVVGRNDVAQEILNETFTRLWTSGPQFTTELAAFAWVYKTSHNLAIDHLRSAFSRSVSIDDLESEVPLTSPSPEDEAARVQLLSRCLERLTPLEGSVYVYKIVDNMTLDEIGEWVGVSGKTVSRMLAKIEGKLTRAKERLYVTNRR